VLKATGWKNSHEMDARVNEVLDKVGLRTKGFKFPHELSGGEQQRVAIARALLNDPAVILADEPTGNLDSDTSDEIMSLLWAIRNNGTSVVMATHDRYILEKYPARKLYCQDGSLEEVIS
jgi:cell division transport system ATP-binding protein